VLELLESGELAKLKTTWWLEKGKCDKEGSPKKVSPASFYRLLRDDTTCRKHQRTKHDILKVFFSSKHCSLENCYTVSVRRLLQKFRVVRNIGYQLSVFAVILINIKNTPSLSISALLQREMYQT